MPATRPLARGIMVVRPLIGFYRSQLLAFLESIGAEFRTDESNFDEARTRSRIRNEALPELVRILGPQILDAVRQTADRVRNVQATIEELAAELLEKSLEDQSPDLVRLNADVLGAREQAHRPGNFRPVVEAAELAATSGWLRELGPTLAVNPRGRDGDADRPHRGDATRQTNRCSPPLLTVSARRRVGKIGRRPIAPVSLCGRSRSG